MDDLTLVDDDIFKIAVLKKAALKMTATASSKNASAKISTCSFQVNTGRI